MSKTSRRWQQYPPLLHCGAHDQSLAIVAEQTHAQAISRMRASATFVRETTEIRSKGRSDEIAATLSL
eukprot:scaffold161350_cov28-Tisochrysis_lutea.AAC.2